MRCPVLTERMVLLQWHSGRWIRQTRRATKSVNSALHAFHTRLCSLFLAHTCQLSSHSHGDAAFFFSLCT